MQFVRALALIAIVAAPVAAFADNLNLSSGSATYNVTFNGSTSTALVSDANAAWTATIPGASWINTTGSGGASVADGTYLYTTTFTLTSPSDVSGAVAADNGAVVSLSGGGISGSDVLASNNSFTTATPFSASDLAAGTYTLSFDVTNGPGDSFDPSGLLVGATTVNSVSATPEPSSLALLGTSILGAAGLARRKFFSR